MQIGIAITKNYTFAIIPKTKIGRTTKSVSIHMFSWSRNTINKPTRPLLDFDSSKLLLLSKTIIRNVDQKLH